VLGSPVACIEEVLLDVFSMDGAKRRGPEEAEDEEA
jgi:hypothetical protein